MSRHNLVWQRALRDNRIRLMEKGETAPDLSKPLAGSCHHQWVNQKSPYAVAQLCKVCKLYRYKTGGTADWEYRAPIPVAQAPQG